MNELAQTDRVRAHTARHINERIDRDTEQRLHELSQQDGPAIAQRLEELGEEWDVERVLEANASALALSGIILGITVNRKWFALSGIVTGFLLMHAMQGWCPPLPVVRRLGIRTRREIDQEAFALKAMRGDLDELPAASDKRQRADVALRAVQLG